MIVALAALLVAIWLFVPKDPFGGMAAYLPFHMFAETFSIVVSIMIFGITWNASRPARPAGLVILSCAMLAVGLLDFAHMLSVSRMPDFVTPSSPDKGIVFWLAARIVAAAGFAFAALWPDAPLRQTASRYAVLAGFLAITALVYWMGLFHLAWFPRFFVPGTGLTPVKITMEFLVVAVLVVPAFVFFRRALRTHATTDIALFTAVAISVLSELYFAIYVARHDLFQVFGHLYKIAAYAYIYLAVFVACVREPYELLHGEIATRKRAEAEILELNTTLEQRVRDRTSQLDAANKELEAFAYSVSHDLRAPLRSIDGFSKVLEEDYADRVDEEGKDTLHRVRAAAQRMGELIDDLLKLSRLSRAELNIEAVDLSSLADSIARALKASDPARSVTFMIAPQVIARADSRLVAVVLENLLGNAWKFTGKHGSARIEFGVTQKDGEPAYFVRDDGAGFDMAHVTNLFTPFQRLHRMSEFPGTGIGLATVRRVVQRHGGRTWAEGSVEKGATFYFTLAPGNAEAPAPGREAALA